MAGIDVAGFNAYVGMYDDGGWDFTAIRASESYPGPWTYALRSSCSDLVSGSVEDVGYACAHVDDIPVCDQR